MYSHHCGRGVAAIVVSVGALALPHAAHAQEGRQPFNIAPGPAANAIAEFAKQAQIKLLASGEHLAGVNTNEVRGNYHVLEALDKLLSGTGLASRLTDSGAIFIAPRAARPAAAQAEARAALPDTPVPPAVVVVSGTRQSIISSIESKKLANTVVDSLIAEDIGQFPDKNIAEAMSRITGVQLSHDFGEGTQVSIRGVQPDLNRIEINGMSVLSSSEGSRAPDLRELPSELIKSIDVVKGVTADTTEGGIGGTVKITTNRPLDFKKFTIAATGSAERNSLRGGTQPRANLLVADRLLDGRLGLMANLVYDKVLTQSDFVRNTGWRFLRDWDMSAEKTVPSLNPLAAAVTARTGCSALAGTSRSDCERQWYDYSPSAARYGLWTRDHRRMTGEFTAQAQLHKDLSAYVSFQRFRQNSRIVDRNYQTDLVAVGRLANAATLPTYNASGVPSGGSCSTLDAASTPAGVVVTNHHVTEYVVGDCLAVAGQGGNGAFSTSVRDFEQRVDTYYRSAGLNWRHGRWDADAMLVRSNTAYRSDNNFLGLTMNAPGLKVSLDSQGLPHFTFPASASPDNAAAYTQALLVYIPAEQKTFEDQLKLDLRYRTGLPLVDRIAFGVQGRKYGSARYSDSGYVANAGSDLASSADDVDVQSSTVRYTWNYDPLNPGTALRPATVMPFMNANNQEIWVSSAQMRELVNAITTTSPAFLAGSSLAGFPASWTTPDYAAAAPYFDTSAFTHDRLEQSPGRDGGVYPQIPVYKVEERVRAAYLRLDFNGDILGHTVEGNVGLRYAGTTTRSTGRYRVLRRVDRSGGNGLFDDRLVGNTIIVKENRYHDYLPSLNAAFWLRDDTLVLRTAYGKVMARPSLDRLNPNLTCIIGSGEVRFGGDGVDDCSGGNPALKPYRAANREISLEWYPRRDSQLSLAHFRKDIATAIQNNVTVRTDLLGDGTLYDVATTVNAPGATTSGLEIAARTALTFLPGPLGGLGVDGSFTRMWYDYAPGRELVNPLDGSQLPFPGMSRTAYNMALWYDKGPLNARVAYSRRAGYYTGSNDTSTGNPLFVEPYGFLDAKLQWRLGKHLSVSLEAKNLTDERTLTTAGSLSRPNEYSWSGRRYFISLGYLH